MTEQGGAKRRAPRRTRWSSCPAPPPGRRWLPGGGGAAAGGRIRPPPSPRRPAPAARPRPGSGARRGRRRCRCGSRSGPETRLCESTPGGPTARRRSASARAYCAFVCCGNEGKHIGRELRDAARKDANNRGGRGSPPGQQNSLILLQLLHEGGVGLGDGAPVFDVIEGGVQVPAVLLHGVGDDRGGGATHAHLAVDQTLGAGFPTTGGEKARRIKNEYKKGGGEAEGGASCERRAYLALVMNL